MYCFRRLHQPADLPFSLNVLKMTNAVNTHTENRDAVGTAGWPPESQGPYDIINSVAGVPARGGWP